MSTLADLLGDINALHPFREGTQRTFLAQLPATPGTPIRWGAMDPDVNIVASQAAHRGDNEPLRTMLDQLVDPASPPPPDEPHHPARTPSSTYAPPPPAREQTDPSPARRFRDRVEVTDLAADKARHASPDRGTHRSKCRRDAPQMVTGTSILGSGPGSRR